MGKILADIDLRNGANILREGVPFISVNGLYYPILASAPTPTAEGQSYYNSTTKTVYVWDGTTWKDLGATGSSGWQPRSIALYSLAGSGATFLSNGQYGIVCSFSNTANDRVLYSDALGNTVSPYDGSNFRLRLHYVLSATAGAADTIIFDQAVRLLGDGGSTQLVVVEQATTINLPANQLADTMLTADLAIVTGAVGAHTLMFGLTRRSSGAGADSYGGNVELISVEIVKI